MSVPFNLEVLSITQTSGVPLRYRYPLDLVSRFCDRPKNPDLAKDLYDKVYRMGIPTMGVAGSNSWQRKALLKFFDSHGDFDAVSGQRSIVAVPFISLFEDPHLFYISVLQKFSQRSYRPMGFRDLLKVQGSDPLGFADFVCFLERAESNPEIVKSLVGKMVFLDFETHKKHVCDWPPEWEMVNVHYRLGCVMQFGAGGEFELCFLAHDEHTHLCFQDVEGEAGKIEEDVYFLTMK